MKKLLFVITALLLFSCSSSDESSNNSNNSLNPPAWIQGTWIGYADSGSGGVGINTGIGFKFTKDDWCSVVGSVTSCWKYIIENSQGQVTTEEEITNTDYIVKIKTGGTINTYHYRKHSATEIEVVTSYGLNPVYKKQ